MIASEILGLGEQGFTFAILTNTASLFAILYIYRKDIVRLAVNSFLYLKTKNRRYKSDFRFVMLIIIGSIPAGVLGILLSDYIAESVSMTTIAVMLFVTGIALWVIRNMKGKKGESDITIKDAFVVGLGQAVALTPGISFRRNHYFRSCCWNETRYGTSISIYAGYSREPRRGYTRSF